jgi:hypothetical protein
VAAQPSRPRKSRAAKERKTVMLSVRIDVPTHAKLSAFVSVRGIDKSTCVSRWIKKNLAGVVLSVPPGDSPDPAESAA